MVRENQEHSGLGIRDPSIMNLALGGSGRYSPPGQHFLEMKMPRSQRITIEQIKEASKEIRRSQKRSRPHRIIIKKRYNAPEEKSAAPQEKDRENIFSRKTGRPYLKSHLTG